ncbi:DUF4167 domain-containing protein [Lichenihabitans sp. PAMC28606]|uniref:DUF4167 domain-containing protein n=1 Tax=Lichenihabitans sp. PAMC28606 TaxID=2880932 RepID=UPI001D0AE942|nr:DUF4167 domain-containing protein [Lichenihabitans sp. PAMC28606]UDL93498.1 DUF4167 domain-containing protein [Lichenihabitans sp. PAMC28606]
MRPGQNKRMRGRNPNNRKGPNPLTRSYESNGPDVKIRGTAHHVAEKYLQLARDAQSSGDPVAAESYLQHAEHYFRLIATAQLAQAQSQVGYVRAVGEVEVDEDDDDDFSALPDRFASPPERVPPQPVASPQPYNDRQGLNGGERQPYNGGGNERPSYNGDRNNADRNTGDRNNGERQERAPERYNQERGGERQDRGERPERQQFDRPYQGDRPDRGNTNNGNNYDRNNRNDRNDRNNRGPRQQRDGQPREFQQPRDFQPRGEFQPRDQQQQQQPYREQNARETQTSEYQDQRDGQRPAIEPQREQPVRDQVTETRQAAIESRPQQATPQPVVETVGLPAFITAPVRSVMPTPSDVEPSSDQQSRRSASSNDDASDGYLPDAPTDGEKFPVRARRRRRTRAEIDADEAVRKAAAGDKASAE